MGDYFGPAGAHKFGHSFKRFLKGSIAGRFPLGFGIYVADGMKLSGSPLHGECSQNSYYGLKVIVPEDKENGG